MVAGSGEEDCAVRFALGIQREEIQGSAILHDPTRTAADLYELFSLKRLDLRGVGADFKFYISHSVSLRV